MLTAKLIANTIHVPRLKPNDLLVSIRVCSSVIDADPDNMAQVAQFALSHEEVPMARRAYSTERVIEQRVKEFERANPEIAEAMKLFGMSMEWYARAVQALSGTKSTTSNSTERLAHGDLD